MVGGAAGRLSGGRGLSSLLGLKTRAECWDDGGGLNKRGLGMQGLPARVVRGGGPGRHGEAREGEQSEQAGADRVGE